MYNRYYPYQYYRSEKAQNPPAPIIPAPPLHPAPKPHKKHEHAKKKLDLKSLKKDTCTSLNDVEHFLNNFSHTLKYIKLIKLLK